jgi:hypothetical protein
LPSCPACGVRLDPADVRHVYRQMNSGVGGGGGMAVGFVGAFAAMELLVGAIGGGQEAMRIVVPVALATGLVLFTAWWAWHFVRGRRLP